MSSRSRLGGGVRDGLITNQNQFDRDWDGDVAARRARNREQWFVELLIPWSSVSMRRSADDHRTIGVYATRYLFSATSVTRARGSRRTPGFLSRFPPLEISQYDVDRGEFEFVPYGTAHLRPLANDTSFKAGADLNWKPRRISGSPRR